MNLDDTSHERSFREEVRAWLANNVPLDLRDPVSFEERLQVDRLLAAGGYLAFSWPTKFGGAGGAPVFAAILDEERALAGIPAAKSPSRLGLNLLGPTLMVHGTPEQRSAFLPPIVRAEVVWCQGFSEPDAGSDLANVRCRIIDRSDHLILEGSKIWTTQADQSDWCFALVRNDGQTERHRNLSFVLVDMNREGISIQPLVDSTGRKTFNQVFFDGVRVENEHMVGKPGDGWQVAMTTLAAERSYAQMSRYREYLVELERLGGLLCKAGGPDIGSWTREYGAVRAAVIGIRNLSYKITSLAAAGEDIGVLPSIAKFWWSTTHQRLVELGYEVAAETGTDVDYWFERFLAARGETIYAGSSQIQLNIISERGLGLPR